MMGEPEPIYAFQMTVFVTETEKNVTRTVTYNMEIEKFAIFGGSKRTIKKYGIEGVGDADIMAEFYQAKHFHTLVVTRETDNLSVVFRRIYERQMPFRFRFTVKSLSPESRFRQLQLVTKRAHLVKPPAPDPASGGDTLKIVYSEPSVFYGYEKNDLLVGEKI